MRCFLLALLECTTELELRGQLVEHYYLWSLVPGRPRLSFCLLQGNKAEDQGCLSALTPGGRL